MNLYVGMVLAALVFLASLISVELGISAAIIEIILGILGGHFLRLPSLDWVQYIASFGGILLTFMAGAEVDFNVLREKSRESLTLGFISFIVPLIGTLLVCFYFLGWEWRASLLAGVAFSGNSLAVIYAILVETKLNRTELGKVIMSSTFVTNFCTALSFSLFFSAPGWGTLVFLFISVFLILFSPWFASLIFERYGTRIIEPEIKLLFLLLLLLMYVAQLGANQALLSAFLLGLALAPLFRGDLELQRKVRVVAFAFITPIFFINAGLGISLELLWTSIALFGLLLALKMGTKLIALYPLAKVVARRESAYLSLLMSTGLTMDMIVATYGYHKQILTQAQFSVFAAAVIASAVLPTIVAQKFFHPQHLKTKITKNTKHPN